MHTPSVKNKKLPLGDGNSPVSAACRPQTEMCSGDRWLTAMNNDWLQHPLSASVDGRHTFSHSSRCTIRPTADAGKQSSSLIHGVSLRLLL